MTAPHTPGPWQAMSASAILQSPRTLVTAGAEHIVDGIYSDLPYDVIEANIRVCAAGPDLLSAAQALLDLRTAGHDAALLMDEHSPIIGALRDAVAKAVGTTA